MSDDDQSKIDAVIEFMRQQWPNDRIAKIDYSRHQPEADSRDGIVFRVVFAPYGKCWWTDEGFSNQKQASK